MVLRSFLGPFPCRTVTSPVHHARIPKFTGIPCNYFYHFYQVHDFIVVSDDGLANLCGFHFQASFDSSNKSSCKYRNSRVDITRISINSHQQTTMPAQKQVPEYIERWRFVQLLVFCIIPNKRIWFSVLLFSNAKKVFAFVYYGCKGERENPCQTGSRPMDQCCKSAFVYCFAFSFAPVYLLNSIKIECTRVLWFWMFVARMTKCVCIEWKSKCRKCMRAKYGCQ